MEKPIATGMARLALARTGLIHGPGTYLFIRQDGNQETRYRVAVRRSDDYVGYLTELLGVPFVYAPKYIPGKGHQTDYGLGADCVAVIIYGMRRAGRHVPYVAPPALYNYMHKIGDSTTLAKTSIHAGDVLHFGFQTAVIAVDRPPRGRLSGNDLIIDSYHRYVEEVRFSSLPYRKMSFDILRWLKPAKAFPDPENKNTTAGQRRYRTNASGGAGNRPSSAG